MFSKILHRFAFSLTVPTHFEMVTSSMCIWGFFCVFFCFVLFAFLTPETKVAMWLSQCGIDTVSLWVIVPHISPHRHHASVCLMCVCMCICRHLLSQSLSWKLEHTILLARLVSQWLPGILLCVRCPFLSAEVSPGILLGSVVWGSELSSWLHCEHYPLSHFPSPHPFMSFFYWYDICWLIHRQILCAFVEWFPPAHST